ncbi:MAG: hypothetical protein ABIJ50_02130 [Pseudomonadota bacterium]
MIITGATGVYAVFELQTAMSIFSAAYWLKKYAEKDKYGREEVGFAVEEPSGVEMSGTTR